MSPEPRTSRYAREATRLSQSKSIHQEAVEETHGRCQQYGWNIVGANAGILQDAQKPASKPHGARNNERHVCARRPVTCGTVRFQQPLAAKLDLLWHFPFT